MDGCRVVSKGETCLGDVSCSGVGVEDEGYVGASIDVGVSKAGTRVRGGECRVGGDVCGMDVKVRA